MQWSDGTRSREPGGRKSDVALAGPWTVEFARGGGAPQSINLGALGSLTQHGDPGVRFFSGTMTYRTTVRLSPRAGQRWRLDLGAVGDLARVTVAQCVSQREVGHDRVRHLV